MFGNRKDGFPIEEKYIIVTIADIISEHNKLSAFY